MKKPDAVFDMHRLPEDERIASIGATAVHHPGKQVAFWTDADPGKVDRYIAKLLAAYPTLSVVSRGPGPVEGVVQVVLVASAVQH